MKSQSVDKPERADIHHLAQQTKSLYISQIALILTFLVCIALCVVLVFSFNRPEKVVVIDVATGKNYGTVSQNYTSDLLEMNLIYYSKEFCESFYNANHTEIESARKIAVSNMHPILKNKLEITNEFYNDSYVKEIKQGLGVSLFDWITIPVITVKNDPRYVVFCQFRRTVKLKGKIYETKHNVIINWIRYKNIDPTQKPSPLFIIDFKDNEENSAEVKKQLQLITK